MNVLEMVYIYLTLLIMNLKDIPVIEVKVKVLLGYIPN